MKLFISHSWRDKTVADRLARDLQNVADTWLDVRELVPGKSIQGSIDNALGEMDYVLALWSENAAQPDCGVHPELDTAMRLGLEIIPCALDDTPLPPVLGDRLAIDFLDYKMGFTKLNIVFVQHLAREVGIADEQALESISDHDGVVNYVQNYRNRQGISGDDAAHWINRILTSLDAVNNQGTELLDRLQRAGEFSKWIMDEINLRQGDVTALQQLLDEVRRNEDIEPAARSTMIRLLEMDIDAATEQAARPVQASAEDSTMSDPLRQHIANIRSQPDCGDQLRQQLGNVPGVNAAALGQYEQALNNAIDAIPAIIEQLAFAGQQAGIGHLLAPLVQQLTNYFLADDDLVPDHYGTLGLLDDAYLAHAYLYQINIAYQASTGLMLLPVDPGMTINVLRAILGPQITGQLDQAVVQSVGQAVQQSQYEQLTQWNQSLGATGGPGSWGGSWEDEMSRMGAEMGISINW